MSDCVEAKAGGGKEHKITLDEFAYIQGMLGAQRLHVLEQACSKGDWESLHMVAAFTLLSELLTADMLCDKVGAEEARQEVIDLTMSGIARPMSEEELVGVVRGVHVPLLHKVTKGHALYAQSVMNVLQNAVDFYLTEDSVE